MQPWGKGTVGNAPMIMNVALGSGFMEIGSGYLLTPRRSRRKIIPPPNKNENTKELQRVEGPERAVEESSDLPKGPESQQTTTETPAPARQTRGTTRPDPGRAAAPRRAAKFGERGAGGRRSRGRRNRAF